MNEGRVLTNRIIISATINGDTREFLADTRDSLLDALRERIGLTGSKEGCNNGNCGACSVILDGRLVNSCLVMAAEVEGSEITTVVISSRLARQAGSLAKAAGG